MLVKNLTSPLNLSNFIKNAYWVWGGGGCVLDSLFFIFFLLLD